jgi:8-amino-7-oxononanoate synthase
MQALTSVKSKKISIFSEKYNHASIIDAIKLVKKSSLISFQIYQNSNLDELIGKLKKDTSDIKIIVTDGVFSMDESIAPLSQLSKISKKYNAFLVIDDAHGFGVLGDNGLGLIDHFNVKKIDTSNLIYMATLGKSCGVSGAFVLGQETLINIMIQKSRTYVYTTAIPPFICYALIKILEDSIFLKQKVKLQNLITHFDNQLNPLKQNVEKTSAIKIFIVKDNKKTLAIQKKALKNNILISCIRPPTVPRDGARIRISINADHKKKDINHLVQFLKNEI